MTIEVRIVSDGTMHGTHIVDAASGREISNVTVANWRLDASDGLATATLTLVKVPLEWHGKADTRWVTLEPIAGDVDDADDHEAG